MDKRILQTYSVWAKENLEKQIEISLKTLGINGDKNIAKAKKVGDFTVIDGDQNSYPAALFDKRQQVVTMIENNGYQNVIEEYAYTWFNRFLALRFMEIHDFLPHGFRVLSDRDGGFEPEILKNVGLVKDELHLDAKVCTGFKERGQIEELFRYVLFHQCNALSGILPMLFSADSDYLELLLPKTLLRGDTVLTKLIEIPEEYFLEDVEIIGWMYQFYISVKKDEVNNSKKKITKDTLPAVTQLFTPDWIVRYMAQNSVGRLWMESYPSSPIRSEMKYYVDDPVQTEEVQRKIDAIKYRNVNPEEIRVIEPCCGSGHILVYVFDLLCKMYEEKGYQKRDIPSLILTKNLVGLDVDKRAAQLAAFALIMKARSVNPRFFNDTYYVAPQVYEILDSQYLIKHGYRAQLSDLHILSAEELGEIEKVATDFKNAKTIGSLLKLKPVKFDVLDTAIEKIKKNTVSTIFNYQFINESVVLLEQLSVLAKVISAKYDVMITNPPYIGTSAMEDPVKNYAAKHYPNSKADMFAMFMETAFVKPKGFLAMINMHSWMFLSSYEKLRIAILTSKDIITMAHLGSRAFEAIGGEVVQTTTFVMRNVKLAGNGVYFRLVDCGDKEADFLSSLSGEMIMAEVGKRYVVNASEFKLLPGNIFCYWLPEAVLSHFEKDKCLDDVGSAKQGLSTSNNNRFLRFWYEVSIDGIDFHCNSCEATTERGKKWFPYNKAGKFRKWSSINEYVVNYQNNGAEIKQTVMEKYPYLNGPGFVVKNTESYFHHGITWNDVATESFCCRYVPDGFIFADAGPMYFSSKDYVMLAYFNSKVFQIFADVICQGLHYSTGHIPQVPYLAENEKQDMVSAKSEECLNISTKDWDAFETSWSFKKHPLVFQTTDVGKAYYAWAAECQSRFDTLKANEKELNRIFIDIYRLQGELTPVVKDKDVTVQLADKERDIKSLISYLIGIVMGRYSLDVDGLAYAGGDWDASKYRTYQPDDDGIVPIYFKVGMEDGLTAKIITLIKQIYGTDTYRQNIDFIAEALNKNSNESSEETLNRYLNDGFYADHLKIYQKRPIYWMFSSGKYNGFKCLIYMHRYNEDTLARINGKYFLPESTRLKNELDELLACIEGSEGRDRIRLEKERQKLATAYNEAIEYDQVLDHMANRYITIDLDDGVKANYAKFQGVEIVSDNGTRVKKDLLVPIK